MNSRKRFLGVVVAFVAASPCAAWAAPVNFSINYTDGAGEGFNDPAKGSARKAALSYSLGLWSNVLNASYTGETITVSASFDPLGGTAVSATLAQAAPTVFNSLNFGAGVGNLWVPGALTNHLFASTVNSSAQIFAQFNSDVDGPTVLGATDFYYGTDSNAGTNADFVSTALHEIGHGLGFTSSLRADNGVYDIQRDGTADLPTIYDFFVQQGSGNFVRNLTPAQRQAAAISNNLSWGGNDGIAANGGIAPRLYAPVVFEQGSSITHLDEATLPFDLLSPSYSGPDHLVSAIDRGILSDMLWDVNAVPEPASLSIVAMGVGALLKRRRRGA